MGKNIEKALVIEDLLRTITVDRSDGETMIDCYLGQENYIDGFLENVKTLLDEEELSLFKHEVNSDSDLESFLSEEGGQELLRAVCEAAYCSWQGITVNDGTRVCEEEYTYYVHWNGTAVESQYESDIDLG